MNNQSNQSNQSDQLDNPKVPIIKFAEIFIPVCPFIWSYNEFVFPIVELKQITKDSFTMANELNRLTKNLQTDFYFVKQKYFKESTSSYISFHSWFYSKISDNKDMTKVKLQTTIFTGLFTNMEITQDNKYGISINHLSKRFLSIHNKRLSPKNTNTFTLNLANESDKKNIQFITVCMVSELQKCCVTHHYLEIE